ncbi:MAG: chorismate mutase [Candidatus Latescibacterota bacterium]|jgi:chorismate mutase-like protein
MAAKDLDIWRKKIDALNEQILDLVNQRAECALAVGEIKRAAGLPLYAPDREMAVLEQIKSLNAGPLSHEAVQRIFKQIIDESLRLEEDHANEAS